MQSYPHTNVSTSGVKSPQRSRGCTCSNSLSEEKLGESQCISCLTKTPQCFLIKWKDTFCLCRSSVKRSTTPFCWWHDFFSHTESTPVIHKCFPSLYTFPYSAVSSQARSQLSMFLLACTECLTLCPSSALARGLERDGQSREAGTLGQGWSEATLHGRLASTQSRST